MFEFALFQKPLKTIITLTKSEKTSRNVKCITQRNKRKKERKEDNIEKCELRRPLLVRRAFPVPLIWRRRQHESIMRISPTGVFSFLQKNYLTTEVNLLSFFESQFCGLRSLYHGVMQWSEGYMSTLGTSKYIWCAVLLHLLYYAPSRERFIASGVCEIWYNLCFNYI